MSVRTSGPGPWCGTWDGYCNHRCRCGECRAAAAAYKRDRRAQPGNPDRIAMRALNKTQAAAASWVRNTQPELWRSMYDAAYTDAEAEELAALAHLPPASPQAGRPQGVEPTGESTPNSPVGESQEVAHG